MNLWIVEDDAGYRRNLQMSLELDESISEVRGFPSCEDFFSALGDDNKPNVVLMDLGLPGISGTEAIERLSQDYPEIKVVVLTVFREKKKVTDALDAGAAGYLLKASDGPEIISCLQQILDGKGFLSPTVA